VPNPIDDEDLFNAIFLAGVRSPGLVTLSGHDRDQNWDIKKADGQGGASTDWKGEEIAQFQASFYLLVDPVQGVDEFAEWDDFADVIRSSLPSTGTIKALDIYHPDLARNDIKSVSQAKIGGLTHDGKGGATVVVKFLEYRPPKKKGGSPNGSKSGASKKTAPKPDPNADLKAEIAALTTQAQAAP
jgi:hypothetical protein